MINFKSLKAVRAGQAGKVIPCQRVEVDPKRLKGYSASSNEEFFSIIGESLSPEGIHTDFIIAAELTSDYKKLKKNDFIILSINNADKKESSELQLKIRKYIMIIDIKQSKEQLWQDVQKNDVFSCGEDMRQLFGEKYDKIKECISNDSDRKVLLSVTYTKEHGREYSMHSSDRLYAKVTAYIDNEDKVTYLNK